MNELLTIRAADERDVPVDALVCSSIRPLLGRVYDEVLKKAPLEPHTSRVASVPG